MNPSHYQDFGAANAPKQWLENLLEEGWPHKEALAALRMQIRGYIDRAGRKESMKVDLEKARWYIVASLLMMENSRGEAVLEVDKVVDVIKKGEFEPLVIAEKPFMKHLMSFPSFKAADREMRYVYESLVRLFLLKSDYRSALATISHWIDASGEDE